MGIQLGLHSIADRIAKTRIVNEVIARNDVTWTPQGEVPSLHARIARISHAKWCLTPGTLAYDVQEELTRCKMTLDMTPLAHAMPAASKADADAAASAPPRGSLEIYTDGGTETGPSPATGWGWAAYSAKPTVYHQWKRLAHGAGRLHGKQSNDIGEAMAVVQALRNVNIADSVTVYIDNTCIGGETW